MAVTKEILKSLHTNINNEVNGWRLNAKRLYEKSQRADLTSTEKAEWQSIQNRTYIDFADSVQAHVKIGFLLAYLETDPALKAEFQGFAAELFSPGQFAVIAVRLNSVEVLELGMDLLLNYSATAHDPNLITELKLIYSSADILSLDADLYLQRFLPTIKDSWTLTFVQFFLNHDKEEKLNSGYKVVHEPSFGYIKNIH